MQNLISFLGIFVFIFFAWTLSEDRKHFPWRVTFWGLGLQFVFAALVFTWKPGAQLFLKLNNVFNALLNFSKEGALFVFGAIGAEQGNGGMLTLKEYLTRLGASSTDPVIQNAVKTGTVPGMFLAFQVLTTIIFFSALLSILYYLGIMQKVVIFFAKIMEHTMRVSGAEALSNSANIFVGQTEAPLVIKPYIEKMTRSELNAIMVGGFANTAGGVLGAYILMLSGYFPNIAAHLISASILSAPAGFIVAKVMVPERHKPKTLGDATLEVPSEDVNLLDAAANGSTVGLQLTLNVIGMLFSFVALIALVNVIVGWIGGFFGTVQGIVQLDVILAAIALGTFAVHRGRKVSDPVMWAGFFRCAGGIWHCDSCCTQCRNDGAAYRSCFVAPNSSCFNSGADAFEDVYACARGPGRGDESRLCSLWTSRVGNSAVHAIDSRVAALAHCLRDGNTGPGLPGRRQVAGRKADPYGIRRVFGSCRHPAGGASRNRHTVGSALYRIGVLCAKRFRELCFDRDSDWRNLAPGSVAPARNRPTGAEGDDWRGHHELYHRLRRGCFL
jgi:nucleoside transporter